MKLSRREFLKGASASAAGGLLLSKVESLEYPGVAPEDKAAIRRQGPVPGSLGSGTVQPAPNGIGPEYVLWEGRLYAVTTWTRSIPYSPLMDGVPWIQPHEELTLKAMLVGGGEMISEQQFKQTIRRSRQLSDANQNNTTEQWLLFAPLWQDATTLRKMADDLEATYQKLVKWARAGAVIRSGVFDRDNDQDQEFLVQLSYFDPDEWEAMATLAIYAQLGSGDLKLMRQLQEKLRETQTHWCPCCEHGEANDGD